MPASTPIVYNVLFALLAAALLSASPCFVVAQNNITNSDPERERIFDNHVINGTYSDTYYGFEIKLPKGWDGVYIPSGIWVSPRGIDPAYLAPGKGEPIDDVMLGIAPVNISTTLEDENVLTFKDHLQKRSAGSEACKISDSFLNINSVSLRNVTQQCGFEGEGKTVDYLFAPDKTDGGFVFLITFRGPTDAVNQHMAEVAQSVHTIKASNPRDIKTAIQ